MRKTTKGITDKELLTGKWDLLPPPPGFLARTEEWGRNASFF